MKVVGFNGSPRKDGNTFILVKTAFRELEKEGIETELVQLGEKEIRGCIACDKCVENKDGRCAVKKDAFNECLEKMVGADGVIFGSPTYCLDVSAQMKALIDRAGHVSKANGRMFKDKIGLALVAVRRVGGCRALETINHFFLNGQMIVPGQCIALGRDRGDVEKDEEGMELAKALGQRMAWLLKKLHA